MHVGSLVIEYSKKLYIPCVLIVLVLFFFRNTLFLNGDYIIQGADYVQTYYNKLYYQKSLLNFDIPVWNPYIYSGYPFLAHPYNGVFYPFNLLFLIMPVNVAYHWVLALHVFLAGWFMFLLVNYLVNNQWAAFVSAVAFMFSGYTVSRIWAGHFEVYITSIWMPLVLLSFLKTIKRKSVPYAILSGFILSVQFFAGHDQSSFFAILMLVIYMVFYSFDDVFISVKSLPYFFFERETKSWNCKMMGHLKNIGATLSLFALVLSIFIIVAAIQLLPTYELVKQSTRAEGISFLRCAYGSFPPEHIIRFLIPDFFGDFLKTLYAGDPDLGEIHWEFTYYIGVLPLIMAIYVIMKGLNERDKRILLFIAIPVFLISGVTRVIFLRLYEIRNNLHGSGDFAHSFVNLLEGVSMSEVPTWKVIPFLFIFVIITILAIKYIRKRFIDHVKVTYDSNKMVLFFAILTFVGLILSMGLYAPGGLYYFLYQFVPPYDKFKHPERHLILCNFSLCVLAGYCMDRLRFKSYLKFGVVLVILVDLFLYGNKYLYLKDINEFFPEEKVVNLLKNDKGMFRILTLPVLKPGCVYEPSCAEFQANASIPLQLYNISGYDPLILRRYHEITNIFQNLPLNDYGETTIRVKDLSNRDFLKFLNVKYVFAGNDVKKYNLNMENFEIIEDFERYRVLLNKEYSSRFTFVQNTIIANNDDNLIKIFKKSFDPEKNVILEAEQLPIPVSNHSTSGNGHEINIISYSPNHINLEVSVNEKGYLSSSEVYYPGWKAFINGEEVKIYRSNYAFRAIFIPFAGEYNVQFRFESASFRYGAIITTLGLCFVGLYFLIFLNKKYRVKRRF